jgi:hypothetical protein
MTSSSTITSYRLEFRDGRPVICSSDGETVKPSTYCDCILRTGEEWIARNRDFVESGIHLYFLCERHDWDRFCCLYWTGEGEYPIPGPEAFDIEAEAQAILAMDPEARFFVRFGEMVPGAWADTYPEQMQQTSTGERLRQLSLAATKGWEDYATYLRHVIAFCESRPWANRVVGYMFFPYGEGATALACEGYFFDASPVMQDAFRAYAQAKYGTEAALRDAWNDPALTFGTVAVPTEAEWQAKRDTLLHWPEPAAVRRERDYFDLQRDLFRTYFRRFFAIGREATAHRPVLLGIDALKQPMAGWLLNQAFGRMDHVTDPMNDFGEMTLVTGGIDVGDLLDEPGWDIVITPSDYTARSVGYGWESEGINDSLRLRGKVMFVENDARTWMGAESETLGAFLTPEEVRAGLLRNTAWALTRGHLHYWMNVGSSYFHDTRIHEAAIRDERRMLDASPNWPHVETEHAICMVLDDGAAYHEDGTAGYQQLACLWQRHLGLAHSGLPYRVYLLSDLAKGNMPRYHTYLFPNLFEMNESRYALLRETVLRDGRLAIFGPATGITDGATLSADWLSRLLGIDFELIPKQAPRRAILHGTHAITRNLPACSTFGDSFAYGPVLAPTRAAVNAGGFTTLGAATTFWFVNKPGVILKEFGKGATGNGVAGARGTDDYAAVWSIAMPLPANLLRECARYAGSHVWCEDDAVVLASETVAAMHSVKTGLHTLHLPTPRPVWDLLTGEKLGTGLTSIQVHLNAPETRVFFFGEDNPCGA